MKKIALLLAAFMFAAASFCQNNGTVYFGNIDKKTSVGLGMNGNNVTLSVMEINKSKSFDKFELSFYDMDGNKKEYGLKADTVYHLNIDRSYAHQQDYGIIPKKAHVF